MVMINQLPIYRDSYILLTEIYKVTNKFARDYKYTLGQDMKRDCLDLFRHLYLANVMPKQREEYIDRFLAAFELFEIEMRLSVDLNVMSLNKMAELALVMESINKQAKAWRKKTSK